MKGWLVSKDSHVHIERWARVLSPYFDSFEVLKADEHTISKWRPNSKKDFVFTTNLLDTSRILDSRIAPERHIAISNSLDLMVSGRGLDEKSLAAKLPNANQIWVDTKWALGLVKTITSAKVDFIPWGLEHLPMEHRTAFRSAYSIVIPRASNEHYNPELLISTVQLFQTEHENSEFIFLDLPPVYQLKLKNSVRNPNKFTFLGKKSESQLIEILKNSSAVLMAPQTDGSSVTMLQALSLGVPVVSTPTIGAIEWLSRDLPNLISNDFSSQSLSSALMFAHSEIRKHDMDSAMQSVFAEANLARNVKRASEAFR